MKLAYINPNATQAMTDSVVRVVSDAVPDIHVVGYTNANGPAAIQGAEDGDAAVPGVLALLDRAVIDGADAIVIACFDDTGLAPARALCPKPVIGIGQAAYVMAGLLGARFSVVTSLPVSIPVIEGNIAEMGYANACAKVRASNLPVLTIDEGSEDTRQKLINSIRKAAQEDRVDSVVLGCAGMAYMREDLAQRSGVMLVDGVVAAAHLARAAVAMGQ